MAHFAEIDSNNIVLRVCVFNNDETPETISTGFGGTWVQTSYNTRGGVHYGQDGLPDTGIPLRKNYAGIGYTYDTARDAFLSPKPFPSWVLDESTCSYISPVPMPTDGMYTWDESSQGWLPI